MAQTGIESDRLDIVIVDDASDPPIEVPPRWPIRLVRLDRNRGAAGARNVGIQESCGDLVAFLDSDDVWLSDKLSEQLRVFDALRQSVDITRLAVGSGFYYPDRFGTRIRSRLPRAGLTTAEFASGCWFCPGSTLLLHRLCLERVGRQDEGLRRLEDLDWFVRFGRLGGELHIAPVMGAVVSPSSLAVYEETILAARRLKTKYAPTGNLPLSCRERSRLEAYLALECGAASLATRRLLKFAWYISNSLVRKPRLRTQLLPFWQTEGDAPPEVELIYAAMKNNMV